VAERGLSGEVLSAFREKGFDTKLSPGYLRLVRGHCEVHVTQDSRGGSCFTMEIPVVRLGPDRHLSPVVASYLDDRNKAGTGPGRFAVDGDVIWYRATAEGEAAPDALALLVLRMQETVERTGPKILNMLR
jgi:hypothetical protein